jgi:hypothetical protein
MKKLLLWLAIIIGGVAVATLALLHYPLAKVAAQRAVIPGELSKPHAFLENNCGACHTPLKGVEARNCVVCHADNKTVLQRLPSAFHAEISECAPCHLEHQGRVDSTTQMDHAALARIGFKQLKSVPQQAGVDAAQIKRWLDETTAAPQSTSAHLRRPEALLNCETCHQTKDRHRGLFGNDCAQCHATEKWTLPEFRHPSSASQSCAQCHQAPPSHYMMHFQMIDQAMCKQPNAKVNQCFLCHQTTSWNDIKGVGFYKHH